jgi:hypothetical protein
MRSSIFWNIMSCSQKSADDLEKYITSIFRVKRKPSKKPGWSISACFLHHVGFLLGLFFDPSYGGDMFLWNVSGLSIATRLYIPEDRNLYNFFCYFYVGVSLDISAKEHGLKDVSENSVLMRIFISGDWKNWVLRRIIICTVHKILLMWSNRWKWDWRSM